MTADAGHWRILKIQPPVGSSTGAAHMNQGWHDPRMGIDWDDEDGSGTCCNTGRNTYLRLWGYKNGSGQIAMFDNYQSNTSNCVRSVVRLERAEDAAPIGWIGNRHANVKNATPNFWIYGDDNGEYLNTIVALIQSQQENWETCGWTGAHVHHEHYDSSNASEDYKIGSPPSAYPYPSAGSYTYDDPVSAPYIKQITWYAP